MLQLPLEICLDDSARLDNYFIEGNKQLFAKLQSLKLSKQDFIYIWGNKDSGKSHLAQAICHDFAANELVAVYLPLDNPQLQPLILEGLEYADLVCLDSLEAIAGNSLWENAIFNLFNVLKANEKQLLVFSRLSCNQLVIELADLKSRFSSMETYKLNELNDEQRISYIKDIGKTRGLDISIDVSKFLLSRTVRETSNLNSIIKLLDKESLIQKRKITIPFIKQVLKL